ncbi:MAG: hypothetical protein GY745_22675 [Actinomycetia bacterium]|nr:hypothetical protein [Actinomycetes bacterium]MCP3910496.1 hypothetical protein [Actinomycetes bacterium]MCP4087823.1 hypothetical protein [Actinomycetes bacterium]
MPDLPEIETLRRDLEKEVAGRKIKDVEISAMRNLGRHATKKQVSSRLEGVKITTVIRKGTLLVFVLDSEERILADLADSGRLVKAANKDAAHDHTQVAIVFTQGGQLRFVACEDDAMLEVLTEEELEAEIADRMGQGVDPAAQPISWTQFGSMLRSRSTKLKTFLMDPDVLIGLGPLYADEILFNAGLRHDRASESLSTQEIRRLYRSVVGTLHDAVKYRGTSLEGDHPWIGLDGQPGEYQEHLQVYGKDGEMSPRARGPIKRVKFSGNWTYFCDQSQV